jgi:hypothetical protein
MFTKPSRTLAPWTRADLFACLACALLGLVVAISPHVAKWFAEGTLDYVADGDDLLYLAISRVPYYDGWSLRDPFAGPDEHVPTLYAWLQFVPLAKLAKLLGLSALRTSLLWRAVGGLLLGASLYAIFRQLLGGTRRPTAWALGCALICLTDAGFARGKPLVQESVLLRGILDPSNAIGANGLAQYRIVTPILNLPWLLLLIAVLAPGGRRGWGAWALGSICLGLCFQLYFFFWTAALLGIGVYLGVRAIAWLAGRARDPEGWKELRFGAAVLAGGLVLGAPQVYGNARTFADPQYRPILDRMYRGRKLAPDDSIRTRYLMNGWPVGEIAAGGAAILGLGLGGLGLPWCMLVAGYLLSTSAVLTGLEFENYHWAYVFAPFGEILVLSAAALLLDGLGPRRWKPALWAVPAAFVAIALVSRPLEALYPRYTRDTTQLARELEPLRPALAELGPDEALAGPGQVNLAVLFTPAALLYQFDQTWVSSPIPTAEVGRRFALNAWLQGMDMPRFLEAANHSEPVAWRGMREPWIAHFRTVLDGGADDLLRRYRVGALLLPSDAPEPSRGGPWRLAAKGPEWALWRREPAPR